MFSPRASLILLCLCRASDGWCQGPPAGGAILTNAAQIRSLDATEAGRHLPVSLRGVVLGEAEPGGNGFAMQDGTAGIYLTDSPNVVSQLHPGDEIEVTGTSDPGWFAPFVVVKTLCKVGVKPLPAPRKVTFDELLNSQFDAQWVEIAGIVRFCEPSPNDTRKLRIELATGGNRLVLRWMLPKAPEPLVDAEVRVRGVCYYLANQNHQLVSPMLAIPREVPIEVDVPAPADPFSQPLRPLDRLMRFSQVGSYGHRVHVRGVVTRYVPGELVFIRGGGLGLRAYTTQRDELKPGDEVDLVGFPKHGNYSPMLEDAVFQNRSSGAAPAPVRVEKADDVGGLDGNLIEMEGIFDKEELSWAEFYEFHTDTGVNFKAMLRDDDQKSALATLPVGGRYKVAGICEVERRTSGSTSGVSQVGSFQILLRSLDDVTMISPPPMWTWQRIIRALTAALAISVSACAAIMFFARRRLKERDARRLAAEKEFALLFAERNRMARQIHDTLAQGLGGISIHLEFIRNRLTAAPPEIAKHLEITRDLVRQSLADARNAIWDMRSQALQEGDLVSALDATMKQLTEGTAVSGRVTVTGRPRRISPMRENDLLHIGQEALSNAVKHAQAKKIELHIDFGEEEIRLSVKDDGRGFSPGTSPSRHDSFGLIGMRERVQELRGDLLVQSSVGAGTEILATVPASG
jgi:signal transduction histidine kinase